MVSSSTRQSGSALGTCGGDRGKGVGRWWWRGRGVVVGGGEGGGGEH